MSLLKNHFQPNPRKYADRAAKQKAYRDRKRVMAGFLKAIRESKTEA